MQIKIIVNNTKKKLDCSRLASKIMAINTKIFIVQKIIKDAIFRL